jgi:hypothetical protein
MGVALGDPRGVPLCTGAPVGLAGIPTGERGVVEKNEGVRWRPGV